MTDPDSAPDYLAAKLVAAALDEQECGIPNTAGMFVAISADIEGVIPAAIRLARAVVSMAKVWEERPEAEPFAYLHIMSSIWAGEDA